ncbi:unnamed protein product [Gadus morhua 'NCC']
MRSQGETDGLKLFLRADSLCCPPPRSCHRPAHQPESQAAINPRCPLVGWTHYQSEAINASATAELAACALCRSRTEAKTGATLPRSPAGWMSGGPGDHVSSPPWLQSESENNVLMDPAPLRGPWVQGGLPWPSGGTGQAGAAGGGGGSKDLRLTEKEIERDQPRLERDQSRRSCLLIVIEEGQRGLSQLLPCMDLMHRDTVSPRGVNPRHCRSLLVIKSMPVTSSPTALGYGAQHQSSESRAAVDGGDIWLLPAVLRYNGAPLPPALTGQCCPPQPPLWPGDRVWS